MNSSDDISFIHLFVPLTTRKAILFLCIIGISIFFMSLFNGFVGDDNTQILDTTAIHSLYNIPRFFLENRLTTTQHVSLGGLYYKPLLDVSYALIYAAFGPVPFFYHMVQVLLFIANACLVFLLFRRFFSQTTAFLLSLLFLIYPITSETALYIADLQDVLFFFFGMIGLLLILRYPSQKTIFIAAGICLLFSMLSKETGVLFLLVYLIYNGFFQKKLFRTMVITGIGVSVLYAMLRIHAVGIFHMAVVNAPIERLTLTERLINIPAMILFYFKTFLLPYTIASSWQWVYPTISFVHFWIPLFIDLVFFTIFLIGFFLTIKKQSHVFVPLYAFFAVWFVSGLAFHLQIFPLDQTVADRWFYFPFVGLLGCVGVVWNEYFTNVTNTRFVSIITIVFIALFLRTFIRTFDFANDFTAASHDAANRTNSYNAEFILSHIYYQQGQLREAKLHAEKSVQLFPYITNYTNLGAIESSMGDYKNAKKAYLNALQYGNDALPYENLAALTVVYGNASQNILFFQEKALKQYPTDWKIWFYYAIVEYLHGDRHLAQHAIQQAKTYAPTPYAPNLLFVAYTIIHSKRLILSTTNGTIRFATE